MAASDRAPGPSRGGACGDPRVPLHPARPDHPAAGRPAQLRPRAAPRHRPAPRGGRTAGRCLTAVLRPPRARRRHRHLREHHRRRRPRPPARRRRTRPPGPPAPHRRHTPTSPTPHTRGAAAGPPDHPAPGGLHARHTRRGAQRTPGDRHRQRAGASLVLTRLRRPRRATPSNARFVFLDPQAKTFFRDWDTVANDTVAILRAEAGRDPHDRDLSDLVGQLSTRSDDFRLRWAAHNVRIHSTGVKLFHHPVVGDLDLPYESLPLAPGSSTSLVATPPNRTPLPSTPWPCSPAGQPASMCPEAPRQPRSSIRARPRNHHATHPDNNGDSTPPQPISARRELLTSYAEGRVA